MKKLLILIYVFLGVILFANSFCLASEDKKSFELETENLWNYYQKITQTYSDWKNEQEIELDEIHKKWVQIGINQITSSIENSDKQDFMKFLFPENGKYSLMLITNPVVDPIRNIVGQATFTAVAIKKFFDSKVELVDMYSERISGGLFNMDSKRIDSLKSFFKKNSEKENTCSFATFILYVKKPDLVKRQDGRWQIKLSNKLIGSCPFIQREKTFEKTIYLIMPYSFQPDLSKIDDNKYINITPSIQPTNVILDIQLLNEFFEWLRKEMKFHNIQI
ncbi:MULTISPECIES: hypothetical protein [Thermodesulfovibrio]|uniref:Uncharacterized protein n=1 Tax=Thermodesulfovibrio yellowstonii TaxID=28262 RepID=A0A9W6GEQ6_9BACT|nr:MULTISPECIES: hypothetical protein [Thermodesulfovibrio]MDI6865432.1 hypothetical protein [Thermodesulfovibrio yellowstonii]GLI52589.1 hypothetical protein TISLANDTSLP1_02820 [Thermodesulfovibrio islandicus]